MIFENIDIVNYKRIWFEVKGLIDRSWFYIQI